MKKVITTSKAPDAVGPYSQAVAANGFLFISGQIPLVPGTGKIKEGGIKEQTRQVLKNIHAIIQEAGYKISDIVKTTVLLSNIKNFGDMNAVYAEFFGDEKPARAAYAVKDLPLGVTIEIEAIASK